MPYIKEDERDYIEKGGVPRTPGELNYTISRRLETYWYQKGESYQTYNDILGALEGAKLELYRTLIGPYETNKALINGALESQPDRAWAAGFFDGEGCLHTGQNRSLNISIKQKEPLLLLRFKEVVGGIGYIRAPSPSTPCWNYTVGRAEDVYAVMLVLWPHLGPIKRRQALVRLQPYSQDRNLAWSLPADIEQDWPDSEIPDKHAKLWKLPPKGLAA